MDIQTQLTNDMKAALKAGQKDRLAVIRMLLSAVKNIDLSPHPTTPEQVIAAYRKKLQKSAEEYEKLGRPVEVQKLQAEMAIVDEYLPQKASPEATERLVDDFLSKQAFTERQFGQAMGMFMKQHGQDVEPGVASQFIRQKLAGR